MNVMGPGFFMFFGSLDISSRNVMNVTQSSRVIDEAGGRVISVSGQRSMPANGERILDPASRNIFTELNTDPWFDIPSEWDIQTTSGSATIENGKLVLTNFIGTVINYNLYTVDAAETYVTTVSVDSYDGAGTAQVAVASLFTGSQVIWSSADGVGDKISQFTNIASPAQIIVRIMTFTGPGTLTLDGISIKSVVNRDRYLT